MLLRALSRGLVVLALLALAGGGAWAYLTRPRLPAAERGRRLASRVGCFSCHGPDGAGGTANPGRPGEIVPDFRGDVMMFASGEDEIREWIRDGVTAKRKASETWRTQRDNGLLVMPAFGDRLSPRQIDDLVAFVRTMSGALAPEDSLPRAGWDLGGKLGCFGCHGPGGRLAGRNRGSLKGYIPSWEGPDFAELVRNRGEFEEWVTHGRARRIQKNPVARYFLDRQTVKMPAYDRFLAPGDLDALWAYVEWLRDSNTRR
jgi:mono/diheme cytochrome c family protein